MSFLQAQVSVKLLTWCTQRHELTLDLTSHLGLLPCSHPKYNKGLAFSDSERDRLYLRGLLPPAVLSQEVQLERAILNIRSKADPLDKYNYLSSLQGRNERLFYR